MSTTRPRSTTCKIVMTAVTLALIQAVGACRQAGPRLLPKPHPDLPDEFQQLLPRGEIAAVDDPVMISAAEAEIADHAWVLGVEIDGQAHAYSLNLLNRHEVVNDRIGDRGIAAVW